MSDLVGNPEDRFSQNEAHMYLNFNSRSLNILHDLAHNVIYHFQYGGFLGMLGLYDGWPDQR